MDVPSDWKRPRFVLCLVGVVVVVVRVVLGGFRRCLLQRYESTAALLVAIGGSGGTTSEVMTQHGFTFALVVSLSHVMWCECILCALL
jgi:hypothetical protein